MHLDLGTLFIICQGISTRRQQTNFFGLRSSCHLLLPV